MPLVQPKPPVILLTGVEYASKLLNACAAAYVISKLHRSNQRMQDDARPSARHTWGPHFVSVYAYRGDSPSLTAAGL